MLTRREVLELTVVFGALALGCSDDDDGGSSSGTAGADAGAGSDASRDSATARRDAASDAAADGGGGVQCRSSITQNHGHTISIPLADLDSSTAKTYAIRGSSDHSHDVTFEPQDLADLKAGLSVKKTSTNGGTTHDHDVTVLCT